MKTIQIIFFVLCFSFCFNGCKKDVAPNNTNSTPTNISKSNVKGKSQKGPFVNGSTVTLYELDGSFNQTGKSYVNQIQDNSGFFSIPSVSLMSPIAIFKADGFYFNEVTGNNSAAPITLFSISDLNAHSSVNINILSSLEMQRVQFLMSSASIGFPVAKAQARAEVLNIFGIVKPNIRDFESLDISDSADDDAILLAVSAIIQGRRTESQLSQLLSDIISDIRTDGILNSASLVRL